MYGDKENQKYRPAGRAGSARKMAYIARYEGRTLNGQVYYLMQNCIRDFEKEHGPIRPEDLK